MSHGVFESGPLGGTYALPQEMPGHLIRHLKAQHQAQSRLYGHSPTAAAFAPPPPQRGRSMTRHLSRARSTPAAPEPVDVPAPVFRGVLICPRFLSLS